VESWAERDAIFCAARYTRGVRLAEDHTVARASPAGVGGWCSRRR
jgi:hypothetical protein